MLNAHGPDDDANDQGYLDTDHAFEASQAAANYYREARREARRPSKTDEIVIDRPAGHEKTFLVGSRELTVRYPLDYGYVAGLINPEDGEPADIFVGSGGPYCGRYMKGAVIDGIWAPDEHKWFTGLTLSELEAMLKLWYDQNQNALCDHQALADHDAVLADMQAYCYGNRRVHADAFAARVAQKAAANAVESNWVAKLAKQRASNSLERTSNSLEVEFLLASLRERDDQIRDRDGQIRHLAAQLGGPWWQVFYRFAEMGLVACVLGAISAVCIGAAVLATSL